MINCSETVVSRKFPYVLGFRVFPRFPWLRDCVFKSSLEAVFDRKNDLNNRNLNDTHNR